MALLISTLKRHLTNSKFIKLAQIKRETIIMEMDHVNG